MSTLEFFDYLVSSEATHDLALSLADIWADRELARPRVLADRARTGVSAASEPSHAAR